MSQGPGFPVPPPSPPPRVGSQAWGATSLLKLMISVRNPCHGSLPETFAFGGAPERGFLAEADNFFNGFLAPQGILGEHVAKHIDICRFE